MHWLAAAATRAGIEGAENLVIPRDVSATEAWAITTRNLGMPADALIALLAPALGLGIADLARADAEAMTLLPERLARQYQVVPLHADKRRLEVATADPTNLEAEHAISFASGRRAEFLLAAPSALEEAMVALYGGGRELDDLLSTIDEQLADAVRVLDDLSPEAIAASEVDSAPIVKLTNLILRDAVMQGASDIHVEPGIKAGVVRFRVDGVMRRYMHLSMVALNRVVSRIKVLGKLDIADRLRPHDGRSRVAIDGKPIDLRISTVCTRDAEKAVIRILRPETTRRLEDVGVTPRELARLRKLLNCRDGIVIVTGPTGSGKTTTLYSAIREIATGEINISTVEDPIEYELPGITQIQVEPKRGVTFASSLRALLRQDPDVIFVGEIRDAETAQIAAQAAMTGHLVLATLHTNDAISTVARLLDLGLDRQTIAATLRGTLAQRLIRRICADCALPVGETLTRDEESLAARHGARPLFRAGGCKACGNSGYRGRIPVMEVAVITPALADMIARGETANALKRAAIQSGMATMRDAGAARVRRGETTLQELERVLGDNTLDDDSALPDLPVTRSTSVLLVNGDPVWRNMTRVLLQSADVRVMEAQDEAEAMRLVADGENFSLILTGLPPAASPVKLTLQRVS